MVSAQERINRTAGDIVRARVQARRQREVQEQFERQRQQEEQQEEQQPQREEKYVVSGNATEGSPSEVLERYDTEAEARAKQAELKKENYARVDVFKSQKEVGEFVAPAQKGDRAKNIPNFASVVDAQTGQNVPYYKSSQYIQKQNLEKAIKEKPQLSFLRKDLYPQIEQPKEFTKEAAIARRPREIVITGRETAGDLIKQLPPNFRTAENQRRLAEEQLKQRELRREEDLNTLNSIRGQNELGINRGDNGGSVRPSSNILDLQKTKGFQSRVQNIQELESARERFSEKFILPYTSKIDIISKKIIPSNNPLLSITRGALRFPFKAPFVLLDIGSQIPVASSKILATGEGLLRKPTRSLVFQELQRAGKEASIQTIQSLKNPETIGELASPFLVKGAIPKSTQTVQNIRLSNAFKKTGTDIITLEQVQQATKLPAILQTPGLSTEILVRELKGVEVKGLGKSGRFADQGVVIQKPIFSEPEFVNPNLVKTPNLIKAEAEARISGKGNIEFGKESNVLPSLSKQSEFSFEFKSSKILTAKEAKEFATPKASVEFFAKDFVPQNIELQKSAIVTFNPFEPTTETGFTGRGKVKPVQKVITGKETPKELGVQLKIGTTAKVPIFQIEKGGFRTTIFRDFGTGQIVKEVKAVRPLFTIKEKVTGKSLTVKELTKPKEIKLSEPKSIESGTGQVLLLEPPKLKTETKSVSKSRKLVSDKAKNAQFLSEQIASTSKAQKQRVGLFFAQRGKTSVRVSQTARAKPSVRFVPLTRSVSSQLQPSVLSQNQFKSLQPIGRVKTSILQLQAQGISNISGVKTSQSQGTSVAQSQGVSTAQAQSQGTSVSQVQSVAQSQGVSILDLRSDLRTRQQFSTRRLGEEKKQIEEESTARIIKSNSYTLQVRKGDKRGDKFVTVEKRLPINLALQRGKEITDNYIEASFRLKPTNSKPRQVDIPTAPNLSKYRRPAKSSKLPSNTFIEKKENRLDSLGEQQQISYLKSLKERRSQILFNAGLTNIDYKTDLNLKLPKTTKIQRTILNIAKEQNAIVTGSFAQKTLLKKSRNFTDIDILTNTPSKLAKLIERKTNLIVRKQKINSKFSIYRAYTKKGKLIADIDPLRFAEEGQAKRYGTIEVEGLKLINLKGRLAAKQLQLARGKSNLKIKKDILQLKSSTFKQINFFKTKSRGFSL